MRYRRRPAVRPRLSRVKARSGQVHHQINAAQCRITTNPHRTRCGSDQHKVQPTGHQIPVLAMASLSFQA